MKKIVFLIISIFITSTILSQDYKELIASGPMLGYNEMREVMIWVQTKNSVETSVNYWPLETPEKKTTTPRIITTAQNAFTAHIRCAMLEPGTTYQYQIVIDNQIVTFPYPLEFTTQPLWQYRTDPPHFMFALGSCAFINEKKYDRNGAPYGGEYEIFETIANTQPDFMLWMGDNTYLREVDWNTRAGYLHRYSHTRATPEMQKLLATTHHYAIWDDHDFGPNNANSSWTHKDFALESFNLFWANNPAYIDGVEGNTFQFQYADCDFYMLDNRFYRTEPDLKGLKETMLGKEQLKWLFSALERSYSPFKFVVLGSPFLNSLTKHENYANYKKERLAILEFIEKNKIEGVVFLTGDKHSSELNTLTLENGIIVYEFTVSPLTSGVYDNCTNDNENLVANTCYAERNFATIQVMGTRTERILHLQLFNTVGELIYQYQIDTNKQLTKLK